MAFPVWLFRPSILNRNVCPAPRAGGRDSCSSKEYVRTSSESPRRFVIFFGVARDWNMLGRGVSEWPLYSEHFRTPNVSSWPVRDGPVRLPVAPPIGRTVGGADLGANAPRGFCVVR